MRQTHRHNLKFHIASARGLREPPRLTLLICERGKAAQGVFAVPQGRQRETRSGQESGSHFRNTQHLDNVHGHTETFKHQTAEVIYKTGLGC